MFKMCNCGFVLFRFHSSSLLILILVDVHELHRLFHDLVASVSLDMVVVVATSHLPAKLLHMGSVLWTLDTASLIFGLVVGTLLMLVVDKKNPWFGARNTFAPWYGTLYGIWCGDDGIWFRFGNEFTRAAGLLYALIT